MKLLCFSMAMVLSPLLAIPSQAQSERTMFIHLKDKTVQEFAVSQVDSISFSDEKDVVDFNMTLDDIHPLYASFSILPVTDPEGTYNTMIVEKDVYDGYANEKDVVADDLKFFQDMADGYGMSLSEVLGMMLISGEYNDYHVELLPETEYVMWAYGMSSEGKQTTPLNKVVFKTPAGTHIQNKININVTRSADKIEAVYTPDDDNLYYTAGIISANDVSDPCLIPQKMQKAISNQIADYVLGEAPLTEYLERGASKGESLGKFEGIKQEDHFYVTAAYLDEECCLCSSVTIMSCKADGTEEIVPSTRNYLKRITAVKRIPSAKFQVEEQKKRLYK